MEGSFHPEFRDLAWAFERQLARWPGGAAMCVYHRGRRVVDLWGGVRDRRGRPWERDTLCVSYSTTKGVVSTALHVLVDRGLLDYDDPVAAHWPEFAQAGKGSIRIRDVLCHRAGLFDIRNLIDDARRMLDWEHMTRALAAARPAPTPDGASAYHALTYGFLVGELIRRASGRSLAEVLRDDLAAPLDLDGLYIGAPPAAMERAAQLIGSGGRSRRRGGAGRRAQLRLVALGLRLAGYPIDVDRATAALMPRGITRFDFSAPEVMAAPIPAANGLFTARSLARLYAALAGGGSLDGVRLLRADTLARATEIQVRGPELVTVFPMYWRLGYHRVATMGGRMPHAFGHFGYGGSGGWADPSRELSFAMTVNSGAGTPFGDLRMVRMSGIVSRCADRAARASAWRSSRAA